MSINKKVRLCIVGIVGVPSCYGGFETLVDNLLNYNSDEFEITIYCSAKNYDKKIKTYKNANLIYLPLQANGVQSILYDIYSLIISAFRGCDCILILGVSGSIFLPFLKIFSKIRILTNIDGLEWRRSKWNRFIKKYLKFSEKLAVKYSDVVIADNDVIARHVLNQYGIHPVTIAYGGDHAILSEGLYHDDGYAFALCRIEPENNVELILSSFSQTNVKLLFVGNWDASEFGKRMKLKYQKFDNIEIISPVYDIDALFDLRRRCSYYIHGHTAGGTNPSLVEIMHFNKTVFAFDCDYNRATTKDLAAYFSSADDLIKLINSSGDIDNSLAMKMLAEKYYTWDAIRAGYYSLFQ